MISLNNAVALFVDGSPRFPLASIFNGILLCSENTISMHSMERLQKRLSQILAMSEKDKETLAFVLDQKYVYTDGPMSEEEATSYVKLLEEGLLVEAVIGSKKVILCTEQGLALYNILKSAI